MNNHLLESAIIAGLILLGVIGLIYLAAWLV
jgi:hypothetical protein